MAKLCVTVCMCVDLFEWGQKGDGKEGEVEEMIDARVRVEPGVDIYGPCLGLDCCSLEGANSGTEDNLRGQWDPSFGCKKKREGEGSQMAQICPLIQTE